MSCLNLVFQVQRGSRHKYHHQVSKSWHQEEVEPRNVTPAHTFTHPRTVMIESSDTNIAHLAMLSPTLPHQIANTAISIRFTLDLSRLPQAHHHSRLGQAHPKIAQQETWTWANDQDFPDERILIKVKVDHPGKKHKGEEESCKEDGVYLGSMYNEDPGWSEARLFRHVVKGLVFRICFL